MRRPLQSYSLMPPPHLSSPRVQFWKFSRKETIIIATHWLQLPWGGFWLPSQADRPLGWQEKQNMRFTETGSENGRETGKKRGWERGSQKISSLENRRPCVDDGGMQFMWGFSTWTLRGHLSWRSRWATGHRAKGVLSLSNHNSPSGLT